MECSIYFYYQLSILFLGIINFVKRIRKTQKQINLSGLGYCEICNEQNILVEHHIRGRKILNSNAVTNIANICDNCHRKVHHGIIVVENRHLTTSGYVLIWHYYKDESITNDDAKPHLI